MRRNDVKKRLLKVLKEEHGFTLPEAIVTMGIMVIALLALHSVFNTSMRVLSFSNDKVESTENARVALERMEREIRAAYPPTSGSTLLTTWTADVIEFQNKPGSGAATTIRFCVDGANLKRKEGSGSCSSGETLTALGLGPPPGSLKFAYFDKNGNPVSPGGSESNVSMVRITLKVTEDGPWVDVNQELITNASLRNRGN